MKKYICNLCKYSTDRKNNFDKHNETNKHKSKFKFICNKCNKQFRDNFNLLRHINKKKSCVNTVVNNTSIISNIQKYKIILNNYKGDNHHYINNLKTNGLTYHNLFNECLEKLNVLIKDEEICGIFKSNDFIKFDQKNIDICTRSNDMEIEKYITEFLSKAFASTYLNINNRETIIIYYDKLFNTLYIKESNNEFIKFNKEFVDVFIDQAKDTLHKIYQKQEIIDILPLITIDKFDYYFTNLCKNIIEYYKNVRNIFDKNNKK